MNRQEFSNNWNEIKNAIKEKWNKLTPEDISQINGNFEHLVSLLQKKYGHNRDQILHELESFKATAAASSPKHASHQSSGSTGHSSPSNQTSRSEQPSKHQSKDSHSNLSSGKNTNDRQDRNDRSQDRNDRSQDRNDRSNKK